MDDKIKEVMDLVREYASESESFPAYATLEDVDTAWKAIESKLRELVPVWLPIESAPRDGTVVLVCGGDADKMAAEDGQKCITAIFDILFKRWEVTGGRSDKVTPLYWMPLPKEPTK